MYEERQFRAVHALLQCSTPHLDAYLILPNSVFCFVRTVIQRLIMICQTQKKSTSFDKVEMHDVWPWYIQVGTRCLQVFEGYAISGETLAGDARCMVLRILANVLPALSEYLWYQTRKFIENLGLGGEIECGEAKHEERDILHNNFHHNGDLEHTTKIFRQNDNIMGGDGWRGARLLWLMIITLPGWYEGGEVTGSDKPTASKPGHEGAVRIRKRNIDQPAVEANDYETQCHIDVISCSIITLMAIFTLASILDNSWIVNWSRYTICNAQALPLLHIPSESELRSSCVPIERRASCRVAENESDEQDCQILQKTTVDFTGASGDYTLFDGCRLRKLGVKSHAVLHDILHQLTSTLTRDFMSGSLINEAHT
ncbi:hypothetical protein EV702DRAFT_1231674 [Suillus placidus]|uniref:Uncharacterized protein n=1 Tax=Suillus placidus TaxID=48579 RepID=A0A9P7A4N8_9AGAM|nr:hypothetical protein EV702DRAFT_1231674 [Suillus placidus]